MKPRSKDTHLPVLLVGSVPLADAREVFATAARELGTKVRRLPDGETGARSNWIAWQRAVFQAIPAFQPSPAREREYQLFPPFMLRPECAIDEVRFGALGFAREALASYAVFRELKASGEIASQMRFQVALPTAWAPVYSFVAYRWQREVHAAYEGALLAELAQIVDAVPQDELSIQWDVATEMSWWEGVYPAPFENVEQGVLDSLERLLSAVPAGVELGLHLCYGSMNNRHWKEPADTANLVAVARGVLARLQRRLDYLHLPVPRNRNDREYFAPLADLDLPADTELYLGLLHLEDGVEGARQRMNAAGPYVRRFGLACECGLGRHASSAIAPLLSLHREVAHRPTLNETNAHSTHKAIS